MKSMDLNQVAALAPHLQTGSGEPLILTENGQTVAAVVPANGQDVEDLLLSINPQFQSILKRSKDRLDAEGGLSSNQVREKLGLPPGSAE
jgi:antitoxin (DNA-binding transcriptional repressor) of toxin-antitoxin stability system